MLIEEVNVTAVHLNLGGVIINSVVVLNGNIVFENSYPQYATLKMQELKKVLPEAKASEMKLNIEEVENGIAGLKDYLKEEKHLDKIKNTKLKPR